MHDHDHRIDNGQLKLGVADLTEAARMRAVGVEILIDERRRDELAPALWALVSVLLRQFSGPVHVVTTPYDLHGPINLTDRITWAAHGGGRAIRVGLGVKPTGGSICGDTRGRVVSFGNTLDVGGPATAVGGVLLAGHLGFACLAEACGIPPYRDDYALGEMVLPATVEEAVVPEHLLVVGVGHVGQSALSLLHFLPRRPSVVLLDRDRFASENRPTQILTRLDSDEWIRKPKAPYIARLLTGCGWEARGRKVELTWGTRRQPGDPEVGLIALDNFDARRMVAGLDLAWMTEAGIGNRLDRPRVTWSACRPTIANLDHLFLREAQKSDGVEAVAQSVRDRLQSTPGQCGWLTFKDTAASAPSMGLVAAAHLLCELTRPTHLRESVKGTALVWSPGIPSLRSLLPA